RQGALLDGVLRGRLGTWRGDGGEFPYRGQYRDNGIFLPHGTRGIASAGQWHVRVERYEWGGDSWALDGRSGRPRHRNPARGGRKGSGFPQRNQRRRGKYSRHRDRSAHLARCHEYCSEAPYIERPVAGFISKSLPFMLSRWRKWIKEGVS